MEALLHGRIDATAAFAEYATEIKAGSGVHIIASSQQVIPQYPRRILVASASSLHNKPSAAVRFLAGEMEGLRYALSHPTAERQLAAAVLHGSASDPGLAYIDRVMTAAHAVSPTMEIPMAKLRWLIGLERRIGILSRAPDLNATVDPSYRLRALALVSGG
jgi:ABC-type nitrate/sulfonate/bicarbonate transport system substrate-binding protein